MRALLLTNTDGPRSPQVTEVETPTPAKGEVRVALKSAALNHRELWISRGLYPGMKLPAIMGADGAGIVDAVGEGVDAGLVGKEVVLYPCSHWGDNPDYPSDEFGCLGMPYAGTFADYICVPADTVSDKPAGFSFAEAAGVPLAGLTAWRGLTVKAGLKAGDKILITGIGGGVAVWALTFAVAMGAEVYVTSSSQEKIDQAIAMGAKGGVNYKEEKWGKALGKLSGGIDVVFDGAPTGATKAYTRALNMGARVVIYGSTGGMSFEVPVPDFFLKHATIYGTALGTVEDFKGMMAFVAEKNLKPVIEKTFPLEEATDAMVHLEEAHQLGKVIISIAD